MSQSQSETANQFFLAPNPLRLKISIFFKLDICGHGPYVTSSLTRGLVCRLQLLLALAIAIIFGSESRGTNDHILLFQIQDFPNLECQVPVFISPRNRMAQFYPQTLGSLFVNDKVSRIDKPNRKKFLRYSSYRLQMDISRRHIIFRLVLHTSDAITLIPTDLQFILREVV
jgi:hypothetical protein